ncbi:MAG TPA: DNA-3-methyladenine glycosylase [Terracidiphilus sp.]|jgi:DNA-3-methyladenine glycosylase|nr:DNA-3-methyladenine glycosylase [Terracidiphilus sp.]
MAKGAQVKRRPVRQPALPGRLLPRSFFEHSPKLVAPQLLGKLLVHRSNAGILAGRVVEAEAYLGPHNDPPDPAAHAHRGPTPRNEVLFGPAGHAYVYAIYGRYFCMNISCEAEGLAGCVLLRALEPVAGADLMAANRGLPSGVASRLLTAGPSRLCQAMGLIRKTHNSLDVTRSDSTLQVRDDGCRVSEVLVTVRIGIKHAVDWPLRFALPGHVCVSGRRGLTGSRVHLTEDSVEEVASVTVN